MPDDVKPAADPPKPPELQKEAAPTPSQTNAVDRDGILKDHGSRLARLEAAGNKKPDEVAAPAAPAPAKRRFRTVLD